MSPAEHVDPHLQLVADIFSREEQVDDMDARMPLGLQPWEQGVVERYFQPPPAGAAPWRVLDVGCGTGREALALAARGYDVVGVDISETQLQRARENAARAGLTVRWEHSDGLHLPAGPFDAAVLWAQVVGNVERRADQVALLSACREALRPGGLLSASTHYAAYCRRVWGDQTEGHWFYPNGRWQKRELKYWLLEPAELEELLREAGLEVLESEVPDSLPAIVHAVGRRPIG